MDGNLVVKFGVKSVVKSVVNFVVKSDVNFVVKNNLKSGSKSSVNVGRQFGVKFVVNSFDKEAGKQQHDFGQKLVGKKLSRSRVGS